MHFLTVPPDAFRGPMNFFGFRCSNLVFAHHTVEKLSGLGLGPGRREARLGPVRSYRAEAGAQVGLQVRAASS